MARWKISNSFIEEVAIKMLSTATYIQNKNNPAYTALCVSKKPSNQKKQGWIFSFEINTTILFLKSFAFGKKPKRWFTCQLQMSQALNKFDIV